MATKQYRALRETLIAHEGRKVNEGDVFSTDFPEGMKLSDNLELADSETEPKPAKAKKSEASAG